MKKLEQFVIRKGVYIKSYFYLHYSSNQGIKFHLKKDDEEGFEFRKRFLERLLKYDA